MIFILRTSAYTTRPIHKSRSARLVWIGTGLGALSASGTMRRNGRDVRWVATMHRTRSGVFMASVFVSIRGLCEKYKRLRSSSFDTVCCSILTFLEVDCG